MRNHHLLGSAAPPHLIRVHLPTAPTLQHLLGHLDRVQAIDARVEQHQGLSLAAATYRGEWNPRVHHSSEEAAARVPSATCAATL